MSDFRDMYKNVNQLKEHQTARRTRLLEEQRRHREEQFSFQRDLKEILSTRNNKKNRLNDLFRYNLMLSEWMMSKPEDIDDFLLIPCPKGIRCSLSIGENNKKPAKLFYKNGQQFLEVQTNLPAYTILDCVYCSASQTIYVLDMTAYNDRDLTACDATFRFFWLKSKFMEDAVMVTDKDKNLKLKLLENFDFSEPFAIKTCFETAFSGFNDKSELDGYLFYHKDGSYTSGESPLVLWLFPFMIDELFDNYKVDQSCHAKRPENYTNYLGFIKEFNEKSKKRNKKKTAQSSGGGAMEHESIEDGITEDSSDDVQAMIDLEMTEFK